MMTIAIILPVQNDSTDIRLADLYEIDEEMDALGHRYYTMESRPIPYTSPKTSTHPASIKAKDAADSLNEAYLEALNTHQMIRSKLIEFKRLVGQPEYADLSCCFGALKKLSGGDKMVTLVCSDVSHGPLCLEGGSKNVENSVKVFNEMLATCHQFLDNADVYLETIKQRIAALKLLAVMQQILTICSLFEARAATNVNIFSTELRSLLLDIRASAKLKL